MGENQGGEEEKTPRGKKRKREGDPEVIKTITTFIDGNGFMITVTNIETLSDH